MRKNRVVKAPLPYFLYRKENAMWEKKETELLTCQGLTVYLFMRLIVYDKQIKITVIKIADN